MAKTLKEIKIKFDAENKSLGRLASMISHTLMGKNLSSFKAHIKENIKVEVINVSKMKITGAKKRDKNYFHYTGYPGGLKAIKLSQLVKKNPTLVLKKAVYNMLPKNRLREKMMKNLSIRI